MREVTAAAENLKKQPWNGIDSGAGGHGSIAYCISFVTAAAGDGMHSMIAGRGDIAASHAMQQRFAARAWQSSPVA